MSVGIALDIALLVVLLTDIYLRLTDGPDASA